MTVGDLINYLSQCDYTFEVLVEGRSIDCVVQHRDITSPPKSYVELN